MFFFPLAEGVLVAVNLLRDTEPHVLFAFHFDGQRWLQRVELDLTPIGGRTRPRFICPVEGRVEVVAFREGRFASIKAQRLLHPSEVRKKGEQDADIDVQRCADGGQEAPKRRAKTRRAEAQALQI